MFDIEVIRKSLFGHDAVDVVTCDVEDREVIVVKSKNSISSSLAAVKMLNHKKTVKMGYSCVAMNSQVQWDDGECWFESYFVVKNNIVQMG